MIEKLINQIYTNVINIVIKDIDEKDKEEVSSNYLKYLYSLYSDKKFNEEDYEKVLGVLIDIEKSRWLNREKNAKLYYLKKDECFDIINEISKKSYALAIKCLNDGVATISKEEADQDIEKLRNCLDRVEEYNKDAAKELVSESMLDLEYASGMVDITSLRLGHMRSK